MHYPRKLSRVSFLVSTRSVRPRHSRASRRFINCSENIIRVEMFYDKEYNLILIFV
jgi:hypothetical protein